MADFKGLGRGLVRGGANPWEKWHALSGLEDRWYVKKKKSETTAKGGVH